MIARMTPVITPNAPPVMTAAREPIAGADDDERWLRYDEQGVDLTLLQAMLDLAPIDRLRQMERQARDIQALMKHGERHRATAAR